MTDSVREPSMSAQQNPTKKASKVTSHIDKINKQIEAKHNQLMQMLANAAAIWGKLQEEYVKKPISEHTAEDLIISRLNPDIYNESKKYDKITQEINQLENEKLNLAAAQKLLFGSVQWLEGAANKQADASWRALALEKAIQVWAAQWQAGNLWAPVGMMSKIQWDISNKYGADAEKIEAQRQAWLAQAAQLQAQIPGQLAWFTGQANVNEFNQAQANYYNKLAGTPDWRWKTVSSTLQVPN